MFCIATQKFSVTGMTCAACAAAVERGVRKVVGVTDVRVSLLTNAMQVSYDAAQTGDTAIINAVIEAGYGAQVFGQKAPEKSASDATGHLAARLISSIILLLCIMLLSMGRMLGIPLPYLFEAGNEVALAFTQFLLCFTVALINKKYFVNGFRALVHKSPNMDTLVAMGSASSMLYGVIRIYEIAYYSAHAMQEKALSLSGDLYFTSGAMILTLITIGKLLESRSKDHTTDAIKKLAKLVPDTALLLRDGKETVVSFSEIRVGDICVVKPGSVIPADGIVIKGHAAIDQSALTGESLPVEVLTGSLVRAGTYNRNGVIQFQVDKTGEETTLSQVIRLVEEAGSSKAPIARLADRISGIFVPSVMGIALLTFIIWCIAGESLSFAWNACISVLVISCPCALGLATPVAIMAGTGRAAQMGVLFRNAEALERAHKISAVVFDKTGTLTKGEVRVTDMFGSKELLPMTAALEAASEHPLAEAILAKIRETQITIPKAETIDILPGFGIRGTIWGNDILVGNIRLMEKEGVVFSDYTAKAAQWMAEGKTVLYTAKNKQPLGIIACSDTLREESACAVRKLWEMGIHTLLLTGDTKATADAMARELGIDEVYSEALPQDKERVIRELQEKGYTVAMVGDGINDAPALARADIGIAVGAGTDIAMDSADVVFLGEGIRAVADVLLLSKAVVRNIRQNLFWAFFYNIIAIPVAACAFWPVLGLKLNPMIGAAAMSCSSVTVVTNALRLSRFGKKTAEEQQTEQPIEQPNENAIEKKEDIPMTKTMKIDGMMCMHCVAHVKKALESFEGVTADVQLAGGKAVITGAEAIENDALRKAVEDAGYTVLSIE